MRVGTSRSGASRSRAARGIAAGAIAGLLAACGTSGSSPSTAPSAQASSPPAATTASSPVPAASPSVPAPSPIVSTPPMPLNATIGPWAVTLVSANESTNARGVSGHVSVVQLQVANASDAVQTLADGSGVMLQGEIRAADGKTYPDAGPEPVTLSDGTTTGAYKVRMTLPPGFAEPLALVIPTPDALTGAVLVLGAPDCDTCGGNIEVPLSAIPRGTATGTFTAAPGNAPGTRFDWASVKVQLDKVAWGMAATGTCAPVTGTLTFTNGAGQEITPAGSVELLDSAGHAEWYGFNVTQTAVRAGAAKAFPLEAPVDGATIGKDCGTPGPYRLVVVLDALRSSGGTTIAAATAHVYAFRG